MVRWPFPFGSCLDRRMLGHSEKFQSLDHFVDQDGAIAQWYFFFFFCFFTLVTGPRWSLSLKLLNTRVYEP